MKSIRKEKVIFLFLALFVLTVAVRTGVCAPISAETAGQVAENFLIHLNAAHTIQSVETVQSGGSPVGYLMRLSPRGYVLVAGDDIRVPIKGYSLRSGFSELPEAYVTVLLQELEVPSSPQYSVMSAPPGDTNAPYWDFLKAPTGMATVQSYVPDTYLLTTQWSQGYPYNKFNPRIGSDLTLTGCVQVAVAQLLRYHAHPATGTGVFSQTWNGQTLTAVMSRPFNWSAMPDKTYNAPEYQQDEVAALMRDLAVMNNADYGVSSTSAAFNSEGFQRAFGYAAISTMSSGNPGFFTTIASEIDDLRPVLLNMPGHLTVADGYASDGAGRKIHVNLGWGGYCDDYYYLDETLSAGGYAFSPDHTIYYNIRPCQGEECTPYVPATSGNPPVITSPLPDVILDGETTIRIDAYDPDGDTVTLSVSSGDARLEADLANNLLTLTPPADNIYSRVTVTAKSKDGAAVKTFKVLCLNEKVYLGAGFDISGRFADQTKVDEYKAWLEGDVTLGGTRGYSNQGFFIWVKDQNGNTVLGPDDETMTGTLSPGVYTIAASCKSGGSAYPWEDAFSSYILNIAVPGVTCTVSDYAASLGIPLTTRGRAMPWLLLLLGD